MFLTCMLWFIFDTEKTPIVFRDLHATYAVLDVIKQQENQSSSQIESASSLNSNVSLQEDCE